MMKNFLLLLLFTGYLISSSTAQINMTARVVKDSLFIPWEIIYGSDDHIWFTQKNGYICRLNPVNGQTDTLYHETNTAINGPTGEGGMLGMALHPSFFSTSPYVYVAYEYYNNSVYTERIARYTYNGSVLQNPVVIYDSIQGATYHNGCRLLIAEGKLFITTGDATQGPNAQDLQSVNGKVLRLNLDGSIPSDNPVPGNPVWSWGHRNPQGLVYANNLLYSSEHGDTVDDELNIISKGRNYGWPYVKGLCDQATEQTFCTDSNVKEPLSSWTPTIAPSGIDYYMHGMFPELHQSVLMATLKDQHLYVLKLKNTLQQTDSIKILANVNFGRLRDICISPQGSIFISTSNSVSGGASAKIDRIIELYDPAYTAVKGIGISNKLLSIYPNPATGQISIFPAIHGTAIKYSITDISGRVVQSAFFNAPSINIAALPSGVYLLYLDGGAYRGVFSKQ